MLNFNFEPCPEFVYDGNNNRLQQIDHTGTQPITTTYSNDIAGLTQVLVADNGSSATGYLYGLDLIGQQVDNDPTRAMFADGLGSVRTEIVNGYIQMATIYDPFGNIIAQAGSSGTVYGFTGEQEDSATGLIYLRARYYNPSLMLFMKSDPWRGNTKSPSTLQGYSYVGNNPINHTDPSGLCIMEGTNGGLCPVENDSLFNYQVITSIPQTGDMYPSIPGSIKEYIQVNYNRQPWGDYKTNKTPHGSTLIPIRHPMSLYGVDSDCYPDVVESIYESSAFAFWEVNARNIVAELVGVITSQREWALRDAIAVANEPYNRQQYNKTLAQGPSENNTFSWKGTTVPWQDVAGKNYASGTLSLKNLLLSSGQFAISSSGLAMNANNENLYHFALVISYGVHKGYFQDTSHGATDYVHRSAANEYHALTCGSEDPEGYQTPLFLYLFPRSVYGGNQFPHALTTVELARNGWPEWGEYPSPYAAGWYAPDECTEVR